MNADDRISELLLRWDELREQGELISAEALCADCPELLEDVRKAIAALMAMYGVPNAPQSLTFIGVSTHITPGPWVDGNSRVRFGPYEIIAPLGAGGMGEVHRARDTRLGRDVAIKLLPLEFVSDADRLARFEREARVVAGLSHPNILVLFDFGTDHGIPYAVTELLEGETLRDRLKHSPLPWRKAVEIAIAIADGLTEAHTKGIIHRDLKPENIFLTSDSRVKILDFGLAKVGVLPHSATIGMQVEGPSPTHSGAILGTFPYMSPEQVRAQPVDGRSDLFAFGSVLYEMLTGKQPFTGNSAAELMAAILHRDVANVTDANTSVPAELSQLVRRCLEKNRETRFQSARDVAFTLRTLLTSVGTAASAPATRRPISSRMLVGFAVATLVACVSLLYWFRPTGGTSPRNDLKASSQSAIASIAILPIVNASGDPQAEYLVDSVPRTMIRSFLEIPDLNVRPFSSVARFARVESLDPSEIGGQLGVEAVLTGRISRGTKGLEISVELLDVVNNRSLWLENYPLQKDMLLVQDDILHQVASKLGRELSDEQQQRFNRRPTQDIAAYLEYLEGLHAAHQFTVVDTRRGIDRLERAVARDPEFALAHATLADAYIAAAYVFMEPRAAFEKARHAAGEALRIDPNLADAYAGMATVKFHADWDWDGAEQDFQKAFRLNPKCTFAYNYYGWYWVARGRKREAIGALEKAVELEPHSNLYNPDLAFVYQHCRRFDEAERQARKTLELDSSNPMAPWALSTVYCHRDRNFAAALEQAQIFHLRDTNRPDGYAMLGWIYGMSGQREKALDVLRQLERLSERSYVHGIAFAWIHTGLGDKDKAFHYLNQVCDERSTGIIYFKLDPLLDTLRDDPRFEVLLKRIGVAE